MAWLRSPGGWASVKRARRAPASRRSRHLTRICIQGPCRSEEHARVRRADEERRGKPRGWPYLLSGTSQLVGSRVEGQPDVDSPEARTRQVPQAHARTVGSTRCARSASVRSTRRRARGARMGEAHRSSIRPSRLPRRLAPLEVSTSGGAPLRFSCVDSLCRLGHLPGPAATLERRTQRVLVRALVAVQHRLGVPPATQLAEHLQRLVHQLRRELAPK